jgi:general secretion pathway protein I
MSGRRTGGFTLLEVMVALAIVSIGLIAVFNGIIQMAHSTSMLRERALADWIAMNTISEIRISRDFPDVGRFDGSTEFAGRQWRWEATVSETGVNDMRRIDMAVAYEDRPEDAITIMTGFVSRGFDGLATRIDWWGAGAGGPADGGGEAEPPPDGAGPADEPEPQDEEE